MGDYYGIGTVSSWPVIETEAERECKALRKSLRVVAEHLDGLRVKAMGARLRKENPDNKVLLVLSVSDVIALAEELEGWRLEE